MSVSNQAPVLIPASLTAAEPTVAGRKRALPAHPLLRGCIALLVTLGFLVFSHEFSLLWQVWSDPLRSIGMLILPVSILLTLRIWRRSGWVLCGKWWGLLLLLLAVAVSVLNQSVLIQSTADGIKFHPIPLTIPIFLYGCGIVVFFAGPSIGRQAWFPLGLLLLCQPVPSFFSLLDHPLQHISASVARSFAAMIGFAPTTPQLRLMFSPNFGMFIAPGCDGIRGAVTMGYVALILGYLKRVSVRRWAAYTAGGVVLGYLFNFTRLCVLVLYYRVALGHPALENVAKQADYVIGSCMFLVATFLFLRILRHQGKAAASEKEPPSLSSSVSTRSLVLRCAALASVVLIALSLSGSVFRGHRKNAELPLSYADRMPSNIGDYALTRTWYEQIAGATVVQAGAYSHPGSDEITLAVWVVPDDGIHDGNDCLLVRGIRPTAVTTRSFATAQGQPVDFRTGFYSDGVTDSIVANAVCMQGTCKHPTYAAFGSDLEFQQTGYLQKETHPVSFTVRIEKPSSGAQQSNTYTDLTSELQRFLAGLDSSRLNHAFE